MRNALARFPMSYIRSDNRSAGSCQTCSEIRNWLQIQDNDVCEASISNLGRVGQGSCQHFAVQTPRLAHPFCSWESSPEDRNLCLEVVLAHPSRMLALPFLQEHMLKNCASSIIFTPSF